MEGFYILVEGELLYAPNSVENKDFQLYKEQKDTYTYPVGGWRWFDSLELAISFFGLGVDAWPVNFPKPEIVE